MPLYEYKCSSCEKISEILHKISDPTPTECPACGSSGSLMKILSPSAFHLKGGGWYADAYSSKTEDSSSKPKDSGTASSSKETSSPKAGTSDKAASNDSKSSASKS